MIYDISSTQLLILPLKSLMRKNFYRVLMKPRYNMFSSLNQIFYIDVENFIIGMDKWIEISHGRRDSELCCAGEANLIT